MAKKLSEMSLEELWQLFPIFLTQHCPCWQEWYLEECAFLLGRLPKNVKIHHIGSTAVSTIWAKPIVDILVEVPTVNGLTECKEILTASGYLCMSENGARISLNKGYTENGFAERVFHLHLRKSGDCDELYFRDYLIDHPEIACAYENLKLRLWKEYEYDRDGYTNAKTAFIREYTERAKGEYGKRY